ncbi:hypothetical protein BDN67DRAFT_985870, partial [Paxillus ammoniavirescens]
HHRFLMAISQLPGWRQTYKFSMMFTWSHIARIELQPDFDTVIKLSFTHLLAHHRAVVPNWAPEDDIIYLWSGSELGHTKMNTRLNNSTFKSTFYTAVTTCGSYFLHHAHKADQASSIPVHLAQQLVRWDPQYRFPFLHKYQISDGFIKVDWFASDELFQFIVHTVSRTDSPVPDGAGCGVWGPAVPNNYLFSTLISLLELQLEDYLGCFSKSPDSNQLTGVQLKHFKAIRTKILHLFKCVNNLNIVSINPEDSNKAWLGKVAFQQKVQEAINSSAVFSNVANTPQL